jgi:NADH:flavin oxidoreductases, Old Yellow Enzyme family
MSYEKLLSPMNIGKMTVKNRVVMAPMLMGFGDFDGKPTEKLMNYYEERAIGGTGLIITEITRVNDKHGAAAFAQLAMSHDYHIEPMRAFADKIHSHGAKLAVQLHHPGRQNLGLCIGTVPLMIPFQNSKAIKRMVFKVVPKYGHTLLEKDLVPKVYAPSVCDRAKFANSRMKAFTHKQIKALINDFVDAAERLQKAGVDAVELHASHGYLIQQFLSPFTNKRTDEYGGSLENRMRFLMEIIAGIRARCGDYPIIVRLTADECYKYIGREGTGYDLTEGVEMAKRLETAGIDAIDVSSAGYDTFNYWLEPTSFDLGWRKYMAAAIKKEVKIPVIAANLIRSPEQAEAQLQEGIQDFVALGRPHIADPHFVEKCEAGHPEDIKRCICCLYCIQSMQDNAFLGTHGRCAVNPLVGREKLELEKNGNGRVIAIVGAGPAGLTAAETLAKRGFKPIVLEKALEAGGQLQLANKGPKKEKIGWCTEDLLTSVKKLGVEIRYNTLATVEVLKALDPYAVIVATGGVAIRPRSIEGNDLPNVCTTTEILSGKVKLSGKNVAVVGSGMTGLETSELLCEQGNKVTIIEMADTVAPGTWFQHVDDAMQKLSKFDVTILTSNKLVKIKKTVL